MRKREKKRTGNITRKLTAGAVFEASTDTSGPFATVMRKHHLLYITTCGPRLLVNNRLAIAVVVAIAVSVGRLILTGITLGWRHDHLFVLIAGAGAAASWTLQDTRLTGHSTTLVVIIAHVAVIPVHRSSLHRHTYNHIRSITSWTIKSFCTLHTVLYTPHCGRSGSFRVRVGVKTSLAC